MVAINASNHGIGAIISHRYPVGQEKAVFHASRSLTTAETLALIFAVKKFHIMIHARKFTLVTDHKPLLAISGSKKEIPTYTASRLQRWALMLLGYDFKLKYRETTEFGQADALTANRIACSTADVDEVVVYRFVVGYQRLYALFQWPSEQ